MDRTQANTGTRPVVEALRFDEAVLQHCLGRDIPVVGVIGGGYSKDRHALARRHGILHHSAARVWQQRGLR